MLTTQFALVLLILVSLSLDVTLNIADLTLALLHRGVHLHGIFGGVLQGLLQVSNLAGELALGGSILSILLLDLGQVFELNGLTLEDRAFHIFDKFLLLLAELVVTELHAMDFLAHGNDFGLTNIRVKSLLHLLLKLSFSLPEQDLTLSLNNFSQNLCFGFLKLGDLVFKLNGLIFELFQLLLELVLNVKVGISEHLLAGFVFVVKIVELVHFEVEVLQSDLQLTNFFVL